MLRPITSVSVMAFLVIAWASLAQAAPRIAPRIAYVRHALRIDIRDLDLARPADLQTLRLRIEGAADEVCDGRRDKGNRYSAEERDLLLPAYEKCRADAVQHALASLHLATMAAQTASLPRTSP